MSLKQSLILFILVMYENAAKQTCDDFFPSKNFNVSKSAINDLISIDNQVQIKTCLTVFGKNKLESGIAELLWKALVKVHKTADDIPEDELQLLGWIAKGIPPQDFMNLSLTNIDTIAAFGKWRDFSKEQLISLKQAFEYQWNYKGSSDLNSQDLAALGQILCVFNTSEIATIQPLAFKGAAADISNLLNCPEDIISEFATLAISNEAFGDPSEWTAIQMASIGCVIGGLESISNIHADAFEGLAATSMQCLPIKTLQAMSIEQISHIPLSALNKLTYEQRSSLDRDQINAIQGTVNILSSVLSNSGFIYRINWLTVTFMTFLKWSTIINIIISSLFNI